MAFLFYTTFALAFVSIKDFGSLIVTLRVADDGMVAIFPYLFSVTLTFHFLESVAKMLGLFFIATDFFMPTYKARML